ncbi:MAG TPA: hypothetical protein VGE18_00275 [Candidatus Paceibacterota bacterium]
MHKRSALIIIALVAALIVVALAFVTRRVGVQSPIVFLDEPQTVMIDEQGSLFNLKAIVAPIAPVANEKAERSRAEILAEYEGKTMSFDDVCQAYPTALSIPQKTVIVFNNRATVERDITIDNRTYSIAANDYALAAVNTVGKYRIDCDKKSSGGTITVTE